MNRGLDRFLQFSGMALCLSVPSGCGRGPESAVEPTKVESEEMAAPVAAGNAELLTKWAGAGVPVAEQMATREVLEAAVCSGDGATVQAVVAAGPDGEAVKAALALAVREGGAGPVKVLLDAGGEPNGESDGASLLAWALAGRSVETVSALVAAGADVNAPLRTPAPEALIGKVNDPTFSYYLRREQGVTPLMLACATGQLDAVRVLLEAGAARNAKTVKHKTTAIWLAGKNQHVEVVQLLLGKDPSPEAQTRRIEISLSRQQAALFENGEPVLESPISSGKKGFATPKGRFVVTNKYRDWKSTLYNDAPMPFFMRLSCSDFGLHAGRLPGYPASHGCIRLPRAQAVAFFEKTEVGTLVEITD